MIFQSLFTSVSPEEKEAAIQAIIEGSTPSDDFFLMTVLSIVMATVGLLLNSAAVIIGSMLIAPILMPTVSIALGVVLADVSLIQRAFSTMFKAVVTGIAFAFIVTIFFPAHELSSEIFARTVPSLAYAVIAFTAGFAVAFSLGKPRLSATLPGVAIAVALIPPLAVIGIGLARFNWTVASGAFILFLVNVLGIIFASMINFSLMNFQAKRKIAAAAVKKEDRRLAEEQARAEKATAQSEPKSAPHG